MHVRFWFLTLALVAVVFGAACVTALAAWPSTRLRPADAALARVVLPGYAGRVAAALVRTPDGARVPVAIRADRLWPLRKVAAGERLTITVTVLRPGWAAWLLGRDARRTFVVTTPAARLRGTWIQVAAGASVDVSFDAPVSLVSLGGKSGHGLAKPLSVVPTGRLASGRDSAGSIEVAAVPRLWEQLPAPVRVSWFPALPDPQVLTEPRPGATLVPDGALTLTFSRPVADVLGAQRPSITPAVDGRWQLLDAHTLRFQPAGAGFALGTNVRVALSRAVVIAGHPATDLTTTLDWQVPIGTTLRLQQLLAQLGYLPLLWHPGGRTAPRTTRSQLAAALTTPHGYFSWRYANTPESLKQLWSPGQSNTITMGAVMMFEHNNDLTVDGIAGPEVWHALIADTVADREREDGYDYVYVHRDIPQSLNLWVDGETILSSPGNTGVPAAPTVLGTFPVFEHIPIGTMQGTNPDGTRYDDPGIRWISYFHGGDAIHTFNRASYGTPQSLGCVELPLAAAAQVWPYTPIGTLVTIEN